MPWSLDYQPPKEPARLEQLFLAVGKALYLASAFEAKCQFLLRIMKIVRHYESTGDTSATADNLISTWLYEIDEKEPAPKGIQGAYREWVFQWVFEGIYGT